MTIKSVTDLDLAGKRTFIRVDFNVPLTADRKVADDSRIRAALPTIRYCLEHDAKVVLASHLGRPKGKKVPELSLEPVAVRLAELLGIEVYLTDEPVGDGARKVVSDLREGRVAMLENLRWIPGETTNDETFSRQLASLTDVYVNDAFGTAHRAHASTEGITKYVKEKAAGLLMFKELKSLSKLVGDVDRPYVAILGGAKVGDKIGVVESLVGKVDKLLIGGAMAYTFLKANGTEVGNSLVESDRISVAREVIKNARLRGVKLLLPVDHTVAPAINAPEADIFTVDDAIPEGMLGLDIGPKTVAMYSKEIIESHTVFWNGPMGVFEVPAFAKGTFDIAKAVAESGSFSVVGGGDSIAAIHQSGYADSISHISTGGGASLEYIEGTTLPGLKALEV